MSCLKLITRIIGIIAVIISILLLTIGIAITLAPIIAGNVSEEWNSDTSSFNHYDSGDQIFLKGEITAKGQMDNRTNITVSNLNITHDKYLYYELDGDGKVELNDSDFFIFTKEDLGTDGDRIFVDATVIEYSDKTNISMENIDYSKDPFFENLASSYEMGAIIIILGFFLLITGIYAVRNSRRIEHVRDFDILNEGNWYELKKRYMIEVGILFSFLIVFFGTLITFEFILNNKNFAMFLFVTLLIVSGLVAVCIPRKLKQYRNSICRIIEGIDLIELNEVLSKKLNENNLYYSSNNKEGFYQYDLENSNIIVYKKSYLFIFDPLYGYFADHILYRGLDFGIEIRVNSNIDVEDPSLVRIKKVIKESIIDTRSEIGNKH